MPDEMMLLNMDDPAHRVMKEELDRRAIEFASTPQQLYAKVRIDSKYAYQNKKAEKDPDRWGWPFRVRIVGCQRSDYLVQGGPGGQYRLDDVDLYVVEDGVEVQISGCAP